MQFCLPESFDSDDTPIPELSNPPKVAMKFCRC